MNGGAMKSGLIFLLLAVFAGLAPLRGVAEEAAPRQESVCLQCHGLQEGRLGEPVQLWRQSVHAANGISCNDCHGGDPGDFANAMSPEKGFLGVPEESAIPDFCGRCHVGVLEDYRASAHGRALQSGGPQCVTCHGNHRVMAASLDLINDKDCTRCHEYGRAEQIRSAMTQVEGRMQNVDGRLVELRRIGVAVKSEADRLFALRNDFHRLFHNVDVERVRHETGRFNERLDLLDQSVAAIDQELRWRKAVGGGIIVLLVLAGVVLLLIRKTYEEEERREGK